MEWSINNLIVIVVIILYDLQLLHLFKVTCEIRKGATSHAVPIGGAKVALHLQIARLKLKDHLKDTQ